MTLADWVEANYGKLRKYAVYRCRGNQDQAEDLLQEILERVLDGRLKVDLAQSPLTYIQQAMWSWHNRIRHGSTKVRVECDGKVWYQDQFVLIGDEWLVAQVHQDEGGGGYDLRPYLIHLSPKHQAVMELYLEGLSQREIAKQLGCPLTTIHDRWVAAVARLKVLALSVGGESGDRGRGEDGRSGSAGTRPTTTTSAYPRTHGLVVPSGPRGLTRRTPRASSAGSGCNGRNPIRRSEPQ